MFGFCSTTNLKKSNLQQFIVWFTLASCGSAQIYQVHVI